MAEQTREPIISVLGHVDHGKTTILDFIRESVVASREAGGITQHIGATDVPFEVIERLCKGLIEKDKIKIPLRGLLFIDTPGHEAFKNLRKRGGSVADLSVLVIDINDGIKPQTDESIEILKQHKTPFVVAANKVDQINGWQNDLGYDRQLPNVVEEFNKKAYKLIGDLSARGFDCDLYKNITDFSKSIAVIPCSGKNGYGIKELMLMLIGLSQTYLSDELTVGLDSPAKGTILEVKETKGLGTTIDAIIYEGTIKVNDGIVVGARKPIVTKVKALLRPKALDEMRDPKKQFKSVRSVYAASGVKIVAPGLDSALPGAPVYVGGDEMVEEILKEIGEVEFEKEEEGVIVKADTLGSLEAMVSILESEDIPVKKGSIGKVSKQDVVEASAVGKENPYYCVILDFNTPVLSDAKSLAEDSNIKIIKNNIIYKIVEDYHLWVEKRKQEEKREYEKSSATPCRFRILAKHTFRQSKPAVVGIEVEAGSLRPGARIMREDGKVYGRIRSIQSAGESIEKAESGTQVAISIDDVVVGKHISENDTLYTFLSIEDTKKLMVDGLDEQEKEVLKQLKKIKRGR